MAASVKTCLTPAATCASRRGVRSSIERRKPMRAILITVLSATSLLLAAGCQTTPEEQQPSAAVEDRKPGAAKPGADARTVERPKIAAVDVTAGKPDPSRALKDPNSILSKRQIFFDYDKYDVKDEYRPLIDAHAKYLRDNPSAK